jgi:hypothetical protein
MPTDQDIRIQSEITSMVQHLYERYPTETYTFIASLLDTIQEQMEKDGKIANTPEDTQDFHFSPPSPSRQSRYDEPSQLEGEQEDSDENI